MSNVSQFIGSGWVPLETIEVTSPVSTVDFDSNIDDTYNNYVVTGTHKLSANANIFSRLKANGSLIGTGYRFLSTNPGSPANSTSTNQLYAVITTYSGSFIAYFMNLRSSDPFKSINSQATGYVSTSPLATMYAQGWNNALINTNIINGIQLFLTTASFNTGKFTLYGIKEL